MKQNFQNYVEAMREKANDKGAKAKTELTPDYSGPSPSSPSLGKFPQNAGGVAQSGKINPYKGGKDAADPNKGFGSDGLGHKGGKGYESMPKSAHGEKEKVLGNYPKNTTMEWLDKKKNLSLAEFTKKVRAERLAGLEFSPASAVDAIKEAVEVCASNKKYILDAILEMKRNDLFEEFFLAMTQQNESFDVLAQLLSTNESFNRKLNQSIFEVAASEDSYGDEDEDHDDDDHDHDDDDHDDDDDDHDHDDDDHDDDDDDHDHDDDDHDHDDDELDDDEEDDDD